MLLHEPLVVDPFMSGNTSSLHFTICLKNKCFLTLIMLDKTSDMPGKHDFELLRKLVLPDGSILRARLPGRPTKDCLFTDPTRDEIRFF